ncbi:MAG: hypothetical protein N3A66_08345, partial [Planctomycetota bacterium]|nr:hypothetical protein [Planctomycetota bacterium]
MPQHAGLVGGRTALSSGQGTVADYVKAAKEAGLRFFVFFEDALRCDEERFNRLIAECREASDDSFVAVPGLCYEDAQGNHLYALGDEVKYPKAEMLFEDKRLKTVQEMRSRAYFDYVNEYLGQKALTGFWQHRENFLHFSDYKLYNSFPVYSFVNGRQVDDALPEYLYWQNIGGLQAILALEVIDSPEQVANRAKNGWRVVWNRDLKALREGKWHHGAWSFSGMGSQYITNGPAILLWQAVNNLTCPNGRWWRPDCWEWRLRLRAASEEGLKSICLYDADRRLLRRWLPAGAKRFEEELIFANCQQIATVLVVEDNKGGRAISMGYWNRNLNMEEFFCTDRCNILGSCRLRRKSDGVQYWTPVGMQGNMGCTPSKAPLELWTRITPAIGLTPNMPTIPVDGAPHGLPAPEIAFLPQVPGEHPLVYNYPATYLIGPEIAVGQANYRLAYDPAEKGARLTNLGHPYVQPQHGWGNSWGGWHRLVPNRKLEGYLRLYVCNWLTQGFRLGWIEMHARCREAVEAGRDGFVIAQT